MDAGRLRTGNSVDVLKELYKTTLTGVVPTDVMNKMVTDYTGSTRFVDRCKDMTVVYDGLVVRVLLKGVEGKAAGGIPLDDDLLEDWLDIGCITPTVCKDSLIVRRYEQAIERDATIKGAMDEMAELMGVQMSQEDAIFNGLKGAK